MPVDRESLGAFEEASDEGGIVRTSIEEGTVVDKDTEVEEENDLVLQIEKEIVPFED